MPTSEFLFLKDKPLETTGELSASKFGHEEISTTLSRIITNCPAPFTIGLFAKWGAGKSTVANSLKGELPKVDIPVIIFDVWKHEGDALRRTFLKETLRQLEEYGSKFFSTGFKLNSRLEKSVTHSSDARFIFHPEKLRQAIKVGLLGAATLGLLGFVFNAVGYLDVFKQLLVSVTGFTAGGAFLLWLLKQSVQLFSNETTSYGVDRFEDPHEFEQEFHNILCSLKHPRILIVFDNVDRVTHDKVANILSTIKTFLEPGDLGDKKREVVFLVPCDARAIKQHLRSIYGSSPTNDFDPDEFLRKFFNAILWIPDFIPSELESFARAKLKDTKVALLNNDYVAWIITKAFRNNPRQIIQFVNILLANYLLVEEREGDGKDFPKDFLKDNMPQLAKYLVLNQLFTDQMEALREKKVLNLQNVVLGDLTEKPDTKANGAFMDFIHETPSIPITNLRIFFTLRRSEQEKKFPGFDSFIALLEDQKTEDSRKYFEQLGDFQNSELFDEFSQAMKAELEAKTNPVSLVNLIYTLLSILDGKKIVLKDTVYGEINNALRNKCQSEIHVIPPDLIDRSLLQRYSAYRSEIVGLWMSTLGTFVSGNPKKISRDRIDGIAQVFSEHTDYLTDEQAQSFKSLLEANLSTDLAVGKKVVTTAAAQQRYITATYVSKFIAGIPEGVQVPEIIDRLEVINALEESFITDQVASSLLEKLTKIQTAENQRTPNNDREKMADEFTRILRKRIGNFKRVSENIRDAFIVSEINCFNSLPQHDQRGILIPLLLELRSLANTKRLSEIDSTAIGSYLAGGSPNLLAGVLSNLSDLDRVEFFEKPFYPYAENRALNDGNYRKALYPHLQQSKKVVFLKRLIEHNYDFWLDFAESLDASEQVNVSSAFDSIWQNFDSRPAQTKKRILDLINKWKAWDKAPIQDVVATMLGTMFCTPDATLQQIALNAYIEGKKSWISDPRSRAISKSVFDWLTKPAVANKNQPYAIKAVILEDQKFNAEEKGQLRQFVFDELIRKGSSASQINLGFEILRDLKPLYSDRKSNFDDVLTRIDNEQNAELKQSLILGLKTLHPGDPSELDKDYWTKVRSLT